MRNAPDSRESELIVAPSSFGVAKRRLVLAVMILFSIYTLTLFRGSASAITNGPTGGRQPTLKSVASTPATDYSKFSHSRPREHADLMGRANCVSCHRRSDGSATPRFPVHKDCMQCHLVQFTSAASQDNPICMICHTREGINSPKAPLKNFSALRSFNAEFDHAQHLQGIESARPLKGCADCHTATSAGVAQTIPTRLDAHAGCYKCHASGGQASGLSSCGSCHKFVRYSPTPITARAYRVGFSHAEHGARQRLSCEGCHNVMGRNLPQARQVSSIATAQHKSNLRARSCMACHDGRRAFGDKGPNFDDCKRCHKGLKFGS